MKRYFILLHILFAFICISNEELIIEGSTSNSINEKEEISKQEDPECKPKVSNKEIYTNLKKRIASIKESCGQVCDTSLTGKEGKYYQVLEKEVNCKALFTNPDIDKASDFQFPPQKIPKYLIEDFSYGGQLKILNYYRDDANGVTHNTDWTKELFDIIQQMYENNQLTGPYGKANTDNIIRHIDEHIPVEGKHVLVIGSQTPWIETILLMKGAKKITTFDYVKIRSENPQVEVLTPEQLSDIYLNQETRYDAMITYSSIEHSGLGRYGDMLNPWGDLITMARAWCLVKPGGRALVGVPSGPDTIIFNSHRLYGPIAYAHTFANWNQIYTENDFAEFNKTGCDHCYQPLHVIERI